MEAGAIVEIAAAALAIDAASGHPGLHCGVLIGQVELTPSQDPLVRVMVVLGLTNHLGGADHHGEDFPCRTQVSIPAGFVMAESGLLPHWLLKELIRASRNRSGFSTGAFSEGRIEPLRAFFRMPGRKNPAVWLVEKTSRLPVLPWIDSGNPVLPA